MLVDRSLKIKKEYNNLKKQETQDIFIKNNYFKLVFNIILGYGDFKDLNRRTAADKAFNIA